MFDSIQTARRPHHCHLFDNQRSAIYLLVRFRGRKCIALNFKIEAYGRFLEHSLARPKRHRFVYARSRSQNTVPISNQTRMLPQN